jgi:hypothetical protein
MGNLEIEKFNNEIDKEIKELEIEANNGLDPTLVQQRINGIIEKYWDSYDPSDELDKYHKEMDESFYVKHELRWGKSINLLEILRLQSIKFGQNLIEEYNQTALDNDDKVFLTLKELHGRACLVTAEIIVLLRNGFPDGAMARWRTLYEILIISDFIKTHGKETAQRYLDFEQIDEYLSLNLYQKNAEKLNKKPLTVEEVANIEKNIQPLSEKYGNLIHNSYGWAAHDLNLSNKKRVNFRAIAEKSDYSHYLPYYSWASYPIHPSSRSLKLVLGQPQYQKRVILVGPSDAAGMAEPGMWTGITLQQINTNLLSIHTTHSRLIQIEMLHFLQEKAKKEFYAASLTPVP